LRSVFADAAYFVAVVIALNILQLEIDLGELLARPEHEYIETLFTYAENLSSSVPLTDDIDPVAFGSFLDDSSHSYF
jgi:hypothetical protein